MERINVIYTCSIIKEHFFLFLQFALFYQRQKLSTDISLGLVCCLQILLIWPVPKFFCFVKVNSLTPNS